MKKVFLAILVMVAVRCNSQQRVDDQTRDLSALKRDYAQLKGENTKLRNQVGSALDRAATLERRVDSLDKRLSESAQGLAQISQDLSGRINQTVQQSDQKISTLDNSLNKNTLYWVLAFLTTLAICAIIYVLLGKRLRVDKTHMEDQLSTTKRSLEEEGIKLDNKLTDLLETQLKIVQQERSSKSLSAGQTEPDHSLALKVADEITRINKNLSAMDSGTKGLKQLAASVKRIEENFAANGYKMPVLLNQPFNPGMKLIVANTIPDENLPAGQELITKIIKPQVNFNNTMIQSAEVEISVGQ